MSSGAPRPISEKRWHILDSDVHETTHYSQARSSPLEFCFDPRRGVDSDHRWESTVWECKLGRLTGPEDKSARIWSTPIVVGSSSRNYLPFQGPHSLGRVPLGRLWSGMEAWLRRSVVATPRTHSPPSFGAAVAPWGAGAVKSSCDDYSVIRITNSLKCSASPSHHMQPRLPTRS